MINEGKRTTVNTISFMSVNYVARQVNYNMTGGWGQGDRTTAEYFQPIETFAERFATILRDIRAMGFDALDLWTVHLNPTWASERHIESAQRLLQEHNLRVVSLAGWFGSTPEEFDATCRLAVALGTDILGGSTSMLQKDRGFVVETLHKHDVRLGIENHPEKTPDELLEKIGDGGAGRIGATVDTGWFGTQGFDAAQALVELRQHLFHVHLKDVLAVGAHDTCRYGQGIVPIERCAEVLQEIGYSGSISIEHEPEHFDPTEDCVAGFKILQSWLAASEERRS
jgi:sugar phosphate isomerase/epimerase